MTELLNRCYYNDVLKEKSGVGYHLPSANEKSGVGYHLPSANEKSGVGYHLPSANEKSSQPNKVGFYLRRRLMKVKNNRLTFITLKREYLDFLSIADDKVPSEHINSNKRPYTGILVSDGLIEYVVPLSSPKEKHKKMQNSIDFHKIDEGKLGAINFNNMLPVNDYSYELMDLRFDDSESINEKYLTLLERQLTWLNIKKNKLEVLTKVKNLLEGYENDTLYSNVKARCCNFPVLEVKCKEWVEHSVNKDVSEKKENQRSRFSKNNEMEM